MGSLSIQVISTSSSADSSSRKLARKFEELFYNAGDTVAFVDIRDLSPTLENGSKSATPESGWCRLKRSVEQCDLLVIAAPIYFYSVGSPARALAENLGNALREKAVLIVTASGSPRSHLAISDFRENLMFEHNVLALPWTVQINGSDIDPDGTFLDGTLSRIESVFLATRGIVWRLATGERSQTELIQRHVAPQR